MGLPRGLKDFGKDSFLIDPTKKAATPYLPGNHPDGDGGDGGDGSGG